MSPWFAATRCHIEAVRSPCTRIRPRQQSTRTQTWRRRQQRFASWQAPPDYFRRVLRGVVESRIVCNRDVVTICPSMPGLPRSSSKHSWGIESGTDPVLDRDPARCSSKSLRVHWRRSGKMPRSQSLVVHIRPTSACRGCHPVSCRPCNFRHTTVHCTPATS